MTCDFHKRTEHKSYIDTSRKKVEIGTSVGPLGTTTHYGYTNAPVESSLAMEHYACRYCGYKTLSLGWIFYPTVPTIKIKKDDNRRVMTIDVGLSLLSLRDMSSDLPICKKPQYLGTKLEEICEKAALTGVSYSWVGPLQALWEAARQLDLKSDKDLTNIELFVEEKSFFSGKSKIPVKEKNRDDEEKKDGDEDKEKPFML